MQLTVEEILAVESGQPLRCVIAGTNLKCVVMRDDVFANLQLPVEVVDNQRFPVSKKGGETGGF